MNTSDCKKFLFDLYPNIPEKSWKRTHKSKDSKGNWLRTFEAWDKVITLVEINDTLSITLNTTGVSPVAKKTPSHISMAKFKEKLVDYCNHDTDYDYVDLKSDDLASDILEHRYEFGNIKQVTPFITADYENPCGASFHTSTTGVPYYKYSYGGDWEEPITCIIYFDNTELKQYTPLDGNLYNMLNMSAYGNDDELDVIARKKQRRLIWHSTYRDIDIDNPDDLNMDSRLEALLTKNINTHLTAVFDNSLQSDIKTSTDEDIPVLPSLQSLGLQLRGITPQALESFKNDFIEYANNVYRTHPDYSPTHESYIVDINYEPDHIEEILLTSMQELEWLESLPFDLPLISAYYDNLDAPSRFGEFNGFQISSEGVPYFGISYGDEHSIRIRAIIYKDGQEFKLYTPYNGNFYNTLNMRAYGYGRDFDLDKEDILKNQKLLYTMARVKPLTEFECIINEFESVLNNVDVEEYGEHLLHSDIDQFLHSVLLKQKPLEDMTFTITYGYKP